MKKIGILIASLGLAIAVIAGILFSKNFILAFPFYMAELVGCIFFPLGFSIMLFPSSLELRNKFAKIVFYISLTLVGFGIYSASHELLGARIEILLGIVILVFFRGPLTFKAKFDKWKMYARSHRDAFLLSLVDFVGIGALMIGILFKFQKWPGGDSLEKFGMLFIVAGMIAWNQKFKKEVVYRKETEDKLKISLEKIEESHKEISDSINYAKRLQDAILPQISQINNSFPESFVLYKPKAIVAGDFYWFENKNGIEFLAAADCTGHGVPGAIVSVVCSNALNRAVLEMNITNPGKILDKVTELVLETFQKSGEQVKDGMDIALISVQAGVEGSGKRSLHFSGANNPLWIIRKNELIEIKGDKQPIGLHDNRTPYFTHKVEIEKGDSVYLFTDGFADQFGGEKGKKFKYKQLSEKLIATNTLKMSEQKNSLEKTFDDWKGNLEQVDDVCLIGIKF